MPVRFLCLANSLKHGGRCVAGIRADTGAWFRPVADADDGTLMPWACALPDGTQPRGLDVVEVEVRRHRPECHQPENWEVASAPWRFVKRLDPMEAERFLARFLTPGPDLLGSPGAHVPYAALRARPAAASLALVEPVVIRWSVAGKPDGRVQPRCVFDLGHATYDLSVTDMVFRDRLLPLGVGHYDSETVGIGAADRVYFTVSLSEPFEGHCYKLVAGVLVFPPGP